MTRLNTCGIAPKERKKLSISFYNDSLYVFGSPSKFPNDMSEQMIYRLNLKNDEWSSYESFKDSIEDVKKQTKLYLKTKSISTGPKAFFFMEYANNNKLNENNEDFLENYELCSFDLSRNALEYYNIPNNDEIFPLKRTHFLLFNQNGQLLFLDNENFHKYDFIKKELKKINRGIILSPNSQWELMDFAFLNKSLYMLAREIEGIKLYFIEESELKEIKLKESNQNLDVFF